MPLILTVDAPPSIRQTIKIVLGATSGTTKPFKPDRTLSVAATLVRD